MKPYSMDLRERVLADCDAGMGTEDVAAKFSVSAAWVRRLKQCRRQTGETAPREQRHGPLSSWQTLGYADPLRQAIAETPDATLEELKDRLGLTVVLSTLCRACAALGLSFKKKESTPPSRIAPTCSRSVRSSTPPRSSCILIGWCSSMRRRPPPT
jgi:transposase